MDKHGLVVPDLDALLSEVPNLLGFVPADSLVLIGFEDFGTGSAMQFTMRIDLPEPEHHVAAAQYLTEFLHGRDTDTAVAAVIGGDREQQRSLVDALGSALDSQQIGLHATWTAEMQPGEKWCCYHGDGCEGTIHDTTASHLAAATAVAGHRSPWGSREEMAASIAAVPDAERRQWADRLDTWRERSAGKDGSLREASAPVFAALEQLRNGEALTTEQAVAALGALDDHVVRDMMLVRREPGAEQLWTLLLRYAPDADVEGPAVLLATASHLHGDGAMASVVLERARDAVAPASPGPLVELLDRMLTLAPHHLRTLLDELADDAGLQLN
ncbi:DUF4192 domain-containing protein [Saccharopolyspora gloriosae]|uniref:DUF4192 domain-containing protein n=1 Tax=Saccharopolyspora gloriosae TaxID=455344 RepID=UPI001FB62E3F|nr:DUF4192 domain-containing protein [Saccharopolyspora gloriosae]